MDDFMKADVFFFVTTIAVVVISILIVIGLVYMIIILRTTKDFAKKVKTEGEEVMDDIKEFRTRMKKKSTFGKFPAIFEFVRKLSQMGKSKKDEDD
jgi:hypothetical protein